MKKINTIILLTTLLAGTLDALAAVIQFLLQGGESPPNVFRFIASGIFGSAAFTGGVSMALAGVFFHYIIACIWVSLYFWIYPKVKPARANKYISGILFGVIIWLVMNLVVLPLSNTPPLEGNLLQDFIGILILITAVGLPVSIIQDKTASQLLPENMNGN